jgi:hypothetical protein
MCLRQIKLEIAEIESILEKEKKLNEPEKEEEELSLDTTSQFS